MSQELVASATKADPFDGAELASASTTSRAGQVIGALLTGGGVLALAGNLLHPRFDGDDVAIYRHIANSTRYAVADGVLLAAFLLLAAGLASLVTGLRTTSGRQRSLLAELARLAVVVGGTLAIAQTTVELTGLRQQARTFVHVPVTDNASAFWATKSLDELNTALSAAWTLTLIGVAPVLIALALHRLGEYPRAFTTAGVLGGVICSGVAIYNLFTAESGNADIPFLVGSLLVTAWVIGTGWWVATAGVSRQLLIRS